ncbi:MAG: hypothetical protein NVS3B25_21350 [Hymenobacter sp.]
MRLCQITGPEALLHEAYHRAVVALGPSHTPNVGDNAYHSLFISSGRGAFWLSNSLSELHDNSSAYQMHLPEDAESVAHELDVIKELQQPAEYVRNLHTHRVHWVLWRNDGHYIAKGRVNVADVYGRVSSTTHWEPITEQEFIDGGIKELAADGIKAGSVCENQRRLEPATVERIAYIKGRPSRLTLNGMPGYDSPFRIVCTGNRHRHPAQCIVSPAHHLDPAWQVLEHQARAAALAKIIGPFGYDQLWGAKRLADAEALFVTLKADQLRRQQEAVVADQMRAGAATLTPCRLPADEAGARIISPLPDEAPGVTAEGILYRRYDDRVYFWTADNEGTALNIETMRDCLNGRCIELITCVGRLTSADLSLFCW